MKKIYIWGVGKYVDIVINSIDYNQCEIKGLFDVNDSKIGTLYDNKYPIYSIREANKYEYDYIICAIKYNDFIDKAIDDYKLTRDKVIIYFGDKKNVTLFNNDKIKIYELENENIILKRRLANYPYEYNQKPIPKIMSMEQTLELVMAENKSLARYGDGEFEMMRGNVRPWFQTPDELLTKKLKKYFADKDSRVLIAIADDFGNLEKFNTDAADAIREYMMPDVREEIMSYIDMQYIYGDAYVSRPYILYNDHSQADRVFRLFKQLWKDRNILIVEGKYSRLGVANDLFDSAKSVRRIICPEKNVFSIYDKVKECIIENTNNGDLVLVSLGPTATLLAYELTFDNIQTIDIGQIDNEYEWFLMKASTRKQICGKSVSELTWCRKPEEVYDKKYENEIIIRLCD